MKNSSKLKSVKTLSKKEQKNVKGGYDTSYCDCEHMAYRELSQYCQRACRG